MNMPVGGMYQPDAAEITRRVHAASALPIIEPFPSAFIPGNLRPAAVLVPLISTAQGWELLFIRRAAVDGDMHSGQVAFPGGACEPGDADTVHTALRETYEEIGIHPEAVQILGNLGRLPTISRYEITPVIGVISWPYALHIHPAEVSRVFTIPLAWLADQRNRADRLRQLPAPFSPVQVIYYSPYDGEILWGATARITVHFLRVLGLLPAE